MIDYAARLLRPVAVVARVGDEGTAMIKSVYPEPEVALTPEAAGLHGQPLMPSREVGHQGTSEIILAVRRVGRGTFADIRGHRQISFVVGIPLNHSGQDTR